MLQTIFYHGRFNKLLQAALNVATKRLHCTAPKANEPQISVKKKTLQYLQTLLNIETVNALEIVLAHRNLTRFPPEILRSTHSLYMQKGITQETLVKYPELLAVTEPEKKLSEIEKLNYEINDVAVLLSLPLHHLMKLIRNELTGKKSLISTMSSLLKINTQKACECIARKPFLNSLSVDKIAKNIELLLKFEVTSKDICNDLWVLKYSTEAITRRLSIAHEHNIDKKTWMVRATEEVFETHLKRRSDNKSILGNNSLAEYLSERLECSLGMAHYMILKQPVLQNKSLKKLKEIIDVLFAAGFRPQHICRVPKILVHSVETTRNRLQQLEEKGIKLESLSILTKSQNQFMQAYDALVSKVKAIN